MTIIPSLTAFEYNNPNLPHLTIPTISGTGGNITNYNNYTIYQINATYNITNNITTNNYYNASNINTTQFSNDNPITINMSWITSFFDGLYCKLTGCSIDSIDINDRKITINSYHTKVFNLGTSWNIEAIPSTDPANAILSFYYSKGALSNELGIFNFSGGFVQTDFYNATVANGTAPYQTISATLNPNLNADLLDGVHADSFCLSNGSNCQSSSSGNPFDQSLNTTDNVTFYNINATNIYDNNGNLSIGILGRSLYDTQGDLALTWDSRYFTNRDGLITLDWEEGNLMDGSMVEMVTIDWINRCLYDSVGNCVLNWTNGVNDYGNYSQWTRDVYTNGYDLYWLDAIIDMSNKYSMNPANREAYADDGVTYTIQWGGTSPTLYDLSGTKSLAWNTRCLYNSTGSCVLNYTTGVSSGGTMGYTNIALTNQTNTFNNNQNFNGNITNSVNASFGIYNSGNCIVIGDLKYLSEC